MIATPSVRCGGWGVLCALREAHCTKLGVGVDFNEWFCAGMRETILAQVIYCAKTNTEL